MKPISQGGFPLQKPSNKNLSLILQIMDFFLRPIVQKLFSVNAYVPEYRNQHIKKACCAYQSTKNSSMPSLGASFLASWSSALTPTMTWVLPWNGWKTFFNDSPNNEYVCARLLRARKKFPAKFTSRCVQLLFHAHIFLLNISTKDWRLMEGKWSISNWKFSRAQLSFARKSSARTLQS